MRTTLTLDPDTRALVERSMRERGIGFKQAVNEAIRAGLGGTPRDAERSFTLPRSLGPARVELTKALALASELEDEAIARKLTEGR